MLSKGEEASKQHGLALLSRRVTWRALVKVPQPPPPPQQHGDNDAHSAGLPGAAGRTARAQPPVRLLQSKASAEGCARAGLLYDNAILPYR